MPVQERTDLLNFAHKNKPRDYIDSYSVAPDHVNAHALMCKHIVKLTNRLITAKYFLKELEQLALDWLEDQFTGLAADQWHIVVREAARTATTSGIGPNISCAPRHAVGVPGSRRQGDCIANVTMIVPAQDWATRFTKLSLLTVYVSVVECASVSVPQCPPPTHMHAGWMVSANTMLAISAL